MGSRRAGVATSLQVLCGALAQAGLGLEPLRRASICASLLNVLPALQRHVSATAAHWGWLVFTVAMTVAGALDAWFEWRWPTSIWFYLALGSFAVAQFLAHRDEMCRADDLHTALDAFRAARPMIECLPPKGALVHRGASSFYVVQARFRNAPNVRTERVAAKGVSARIEFWDAHRATRLLGPVYGQLASKSKAPDYVGWEAISPTIDFEANDLPLKLYIALRPPGCREAYVFCSENLEAREDGQHPDYRLEFGTYQVGVKLRASNVEQDFWFRLRNPGQGGAALALEPLAH